MQVLVLLLIPAFSVNITNYENLIHYGSISISNQKIKVLFDTGSSLSWVASTSCLTCGIKSSPKFDPQLSKTFKPLGQSFEIQYGSGSIRGELALDSILIDDILLTEVEIGIVTEEFGFTFKKIPINGLIALAPGQSSESFIGRLKEKDLKIIEINLAMNDLETGFIKFHSEYNIEKKKTIMKDKWMVGMEIIRFGNLDFCYLMGSCRAVIDTGSSLFIVPRFVYREVVKKFRINADCSNFFIVPELEIGFDGIYFEVQSDDMVLVDESFCTLAFMALDLYDGIGEFMVLGGTFIRNNIVILDIFEESIAIRSKHLIFPQNKLIKNP